MHPSQWIDDARAGSGEGESGGETTHGAVSLTAISLEVVQ
jgi:hypothetical protein